MDTWSPLEKLAGWALALGAVVGGFAGLFHPDDAVVGNVFSPAWRPVHFAQVIGFGVPAFGIAAAWPQLAAGGRRFASVALIATVAGSIAGAAGALVEATLLPVVLRSLAPTSLVDLFKPGGPLPELVIPMVVTILFWLVGHVLLGIAVLRSGMLPKAMGAILIAGTVLQFTPLPGIGHGLTIVLHDTGLLWLAAACLRRDAVPHRPAGAATPRAA